VQVLLCSADRERRENIRCNGGERHIDVPHALQCRAFVLGHSAAGITVENAEAASG